MKLLLLSLCLGFFLVGRAQIPTGYYDGVAGKSGEELREALRDIISNGHVKLPYTSSSFDVWNAYAFTDMRLAPNDTYIWDMYSDIPDGVPAYYFTIYTNQCGTAAQEGDCYSREHLMPNSWWGGIDNSANPQYTDLHHLFPADQYVNNKKSAHVVAETDAPTWTSTNGSKVGPCSLDGYSGTVFEPINEYKGDFARAFLYLATRYMDNMSNWVNSYPNTEGQYVISTSGGDYLDWYIDMLISWNNSDPVCQKEINRNDSIYYATPQHNRNPFIDHPEYVCLIWNCPDAPVINQIEQTPTYPNSTNEVTVSADVTDDFTLTSVVLQWCTDGASYDHSIDMSVDVAPIYISNSAIPAQEAGTTISYRIVASDNNGNTTYSLVNSYTVIKDEPSSYPTSFVCSSTTSSAITLTWTDASSTILPDGYLIKGSKVSLDAISDPGDGTPESNSTLVKSVSKGVQTIKLSGLSASTAYYFKIYPYSNSLASINFKTDGTIPSTNGTTAAGSSGSGCASDLIISEYIEGTSNNKYIEIYNNTGATVSLSDYQLLLFSNGASAANTTVTLSGTLNDQQTIVYKNSSAATYTGTATTNSAVNFNGDDAIALYKVSTESYVDIFGRIGEDPGSEWIDGTRSTLNSTLVRNATVTTGVTTNPASGFPTLSTEWTAYSTDDVSNLGAHTMTCATCSAPILQASNINITMVSTNSMTINWTNGDGEKRLVVLCQEYPIEEIPVDGTTYHADTLFGNGDELGPDEYVIYNGEESTVTVSNLSAEQTYYLSIFEYNCEAGSELYLSPGETSSQGTNALDKEACIAPTAASTSRDSICENDEGTIELTAVGGSGTTLAWYTSSAADSLIGTGSPLSIALPVVTSTFYVRWENDYDSSAFTSVTVNIVSVDSVSLSIEASETAFCEGTLVTFTSTAINGGDTPGYQWYLNDTALTGEVEPVFISNLLSNKDVVRCTLITSKSCVIEPTAYDSIVVTVHPVPETPVVSLDGYVLSSDATEGNQWFNSDGPVDGETNQSFVVNTTDNYFVVVTNNGCSSDTSNIIHVIYQVTEICEDDVVYNIYPNPVENLLTIVVEDDEMVNYGIYNLLGAEVLKGNFKGKTFIKTNELKPGLYVIELKNGENTKLIKLIKDN